MEQMSVTEIIVKLKEKRAAMIQAEQALGENLVWLTDKLDLYVRQGDVETLRRLEQLTNAWIALCIVLPVK